MGIYNPTCKYGGITTVEYLDNKYKESITICQNHSGQIEKSIIIYSKNTSLVLVLYWYNMYQNITSSFTFSLTRCKTVTIKLCEYNAHCTNILNATRSVEDMNVCNSYFSRVKKWSYMNFITGPYLGSVILFTHIDDQCSIVQFSSRNMMVVASVDVDFSPVRCHAYLVLRRISLPTHAVANRQVEFIIKGNFGKYRRKADSVQMLGEPEKLDIYSPQLNFTGNRYNEKIFSSFHIYAQINTSKYFDEFQISISLSLPYSWVDIIVKQTAPNMPSQLETQINLFHIATVNFTQQHYYSFQKTRFRSVMLLEFGGNDSNEFIPSDVMLHIDLVKYLGKFSVERKTISFKNGVPIFAVDQTDFHLYYPTSRICNFLFF